MIKFFFAQVTADNCFPSFETKSLKLINTKFGNWVLLVNMYMPYKGPKRVKSEEI